MAIRKIRKSWWVDFRADHIRYRKRSPENSRAGAQAYEAMLRQKLSRVGSLEENIKEKSAPQTFEQFAWSWFEAYAVPNNKFSEQKAKRSALKCSLIPFFGKMLVEKITEQHVEQFKAQGVRDGYSRKTINNRLAVFSGCMSAAYSWLKLEGKPPKVVWLKCAPSRYDYLSPDECALLHAGANGILGEMILTALRTGMRLGELIGLQWSSIDWQNRMITVRYSMCYYSRELISPKSNRTRIIPIDIDVFEMLLRRKSETGYVFTDAKNRPLGGRGLLTNLKKVAQKVGLRAIGWHTLRHTFATHAAGKIQLHELQALLGHSNVSTTMRYVHVAPSALRNAIDLLNPKTALHGTFGHMQGNVWQHDAQKESA